MQVLEDVATYFLDWAKTIWNFCIGSWLLAVPIGLAITSRIFDLLKRFLGK